MSEPNDAPIPRKVHAIVWILTGVVLFLIFCICAILAFFLVYGQKLIYIL